jgi:hypothetical protein
VLKTKSKIYTVITKGLTGWKTKTEKAQKEVQTQQLTK